jgi:hypothetical protein
MNHRLLLVAAAAAAIASTAASQSNTVAGLDGNLYDIGSPTVWGRRGPAKPNGEIGFSGSNTMCNPGTVPIPWFAQMAENHPKFGFMMVRVTNDRMVQISDRSYCKHAFLSLNSGSGPCLPCSNPGASGNQMLIGCSDVYSASNNGSRSNLGPADEIDPWLGTWNHVGSYFDRGDPDVGPPGNVDGVQNSISAPDQVKNRVTIKDSDLLVPNSQFFFQIHLLHQGEAVANRGNNLRNRGLSFTDSPTATGGYSVASVGNSFGGSVLTRWTGSTLNVGGNGVDDGRIEIAVKVTGPTNGLWHYEYAVHNIDNNRGAAAMHLPACTTARILNSGFRDIDTNALNDWSQTNSGGELLYSAPAGNALRWNMLFNFWFDSDAAPVAGNATFDEALVGPGALSFTVPTQVPGYVPNIYLGAGCGTPGVTLAPNGIATDNPAFALVISTAPFTPVFLFGGSAANAPLPPCTVYLGGTLQSFGFALTDVAGAASFPLPVPTGLVGQMAFQGASYMPGAGAFLGDFNLTNGVLARAGLSGCQ